MQLNVKDRVFSNVSEPCWANHHKSGPRIILHVHFPGHSQQEKTKTHFSYLHSFYLQALVTYQCPLTEHGLHRTCALSCTTVTLSCVSCLFIPVYTRSGIYCRGYCWWLNNKNIIDWSCDRKMRSTESAIRCSTLSGDYGADFLGKSQSAGHFPLSYGNVNIFYSLY